MGCDHPFVSFLFSCGYLGLFLLLVVCLCTYMCFFFFCLGVLLFSLSLFWWFLTFCFAGVVALALTMRTLCHLGVGVEKSRSCFLQKVFKNSTKKNLFVGFWEFCVIFD